MKEEAFILMRLKKWSWYGLYVVLTAIGISVFSMSSGQASGVVNSGHGMEPDAQLQGQNAYAFVGDIPAGQSVTIIYDARVATNLSDDVSQLSTQGTVSGSNFTAILTDDPSTSTQNDPTLTLLGDLNQPGLSKIGLLSDGALGLEGESITWQVTASNFSEAPFTNVVITDTVDAAMQVIDVTSNTGNVTVNGQVVEVTIPAFNPGETVQISIQATVVETPASGLLVNEVTLTADDGFLRRARATINAVTGLPDTGYPPQD